MLVAAAVVALALAIVAGTNRFVVAAYTVTSGSMEPTLQVGDRILVDRMVGPDQLQHGDVVVLAGLPWEGGATLVKRVVGLPGDRVVCCTADGRLTVDGTPVTEPYLYPGDAASLIRFDVVVPPDHLWVLGDHRSSSDDSRHHLGDPGGGFVPFADVVGTVWVRYWPSQRFGRVDAARTLPGGSREHG